MSLTNPNSVVTEQRLHDFYGQISPYLGGMPEVLANKFSKGDLYDTSEKMIGQWIDNKPIYQKVIVKENFRIADDASFAHGIANVDKIFIKEGFLDDNGSFVMIPLLWSTSYNGVLINATNVVFKGNGVWGADETRTLYFVVQYTKTTDSAISIGDETDYSTTEKIVGTWITGAPIWQKTVVYDKTTNDTQFLIPHNISNIGMVVRCEAGYWDTTNNIYRSLPANWIKPDGTQGTAINSLLVNTTNIIFRTYTGETDGNGKILVTIQYTKTT